MAKSLINLSMTLRNVATLSRRFCTVKVDSYNNEIKAISSEVKIKATSVRELFDILKRDMDPLTLVSSMEVNKHLVEGRHVVTALTSMYNYYKTQSVPVAEIKNDEHFKKLCYILSKKLLSLHSPHIIQALKILNLIQIPSSTMLMQSLLQLLRNSINDLNLTEIFYMSYLIQHMDRTPLCNALAIALPKVFEAQYQLQIDRDDIKELKNSLRYASDYVQNKEVIKYIVDAIDNYDGALDLDSALHIFWSLSIIKELPINYLSVLTKVKSVIIKYIQIMNSFEVSKTLKYISITESTGIQGFYDPVLVDNLVNKIIQDNYDFSTAIVSLNGLNRIRHIHLKLLDYLSYQCCENPKLLRDCNELSLMTLSAGLAFANYKPNNWDVLQKLLIANHNRLILDLRNFNYFAVNLAAVDCLDSRIFETAFKYDYNGELNRNMKDHKFKKLYYCAKILYPEYTGPWPSDKVIESFKDATITDYDKPTEYLLLPALEYVLKDSSYIKTNLMTKEGIYIDYLIILKDRSPVAFEITESQNMLDSTINVEDLNIPSDLKRVAVLQLPSKVYGKNIKILQASVELNIKLLKALSYEVIAVSEEIWNNMPEYELIPYLQKSLNIERNESSSSIKNR